MRRPREGGPLLEADTEPGDTRPEDDWNASPWEPAAHDARGGGPDGGPGAFERLYRLFIGARAVLGGVLVATAIAFGAFGVNLAAAGLVLCVAYAALSIGLWLLPRFRTARAPQSMARLRSPRWLATIGVDISCFLALYALSANSGLNSLPLLGLPVLMAGVLTPRPLALATAAGVTLALLGVTWLAVLGGGQPTVLLTQVGLAGSGFFLIAVLGGELAARLAREELAARGSLQLARQQAELNRLVIREMTDGVLVVDRDGRVRAANPAARALLVPTGRAPQAPFWLDVEAAWQPLAAAVERAYAEAAWPEAGRDVPLDFAEGAARILRVRMRFTSRPDQPAGETFCVLFLEDLRSVEARMRQERLAAMGRISAGVAHEIRNPLAAIAQANALLAEDLESPAHRQLARMVADNVARLKRIVDDVMAVAPGAAEVAPAIDARAEVEAACVDWLHAAGDGDDGGELLRLELPAAPVDVAFDPDHLRRVLVNLLDNARRHASGAPGASPCGSASTTPAGRRSRWRATARRCRPRSSATCSSPSTRRAAAAPGWASTSAASCASATARRSASRCTRKASGCATSSTSGCAARVPARRRRRRPGPTPHDADASRRPAQPARRRRRARPAHALRADAAARGLRRRDRGRRRAGAGECCAGSATTR